jgi:hypothetical protein
MYVYKRERADRASCTRYSSKFETGQPVTGIALPKLYESGVVHIGEYMNSAVLCAMKPHDAVCVVSVVALYALGTPLKNSVVWTNTSFWYLTIL